MSDCENIIKVNGLSKAYSREKPPVYAVYHAEFADRKSTRLNSSHVRTSRMPSSA